LDKQKVMDNHFIDSIYVKKGNKDFIVAELSIDVEKTIKLLTDIKDYAKSQKGYFNVSMLKSKKDPEKYYLKYVLWEQKPEVTAKQQMPDREDDDLPF